MVNILEHELVPKHEVLPKKEKEELLKRLGITKDKLPRIFVSDPVAASLQAKAWDIIKITRKSLTAGESVYYRIVVE